MLLVPMTGCKRQFTGLRILQVTWAASLVRRAGSGSASARGLARAVERRMSEMMNFIVEGWNSSLGMMVEIVMWIACGEGDIYVSVRDVCCREEPPGHDFPA